MKVGPFILGGKTFNIVQSGKLNFNYEAAIQYPGIASATGIVQLDVLTSGIGTIVSGIIPNISIGTVGTFQYSTGVKLTPSGAYLMTPVSRHGSLQYPVLSYNTQVQYNSSSGVFYTIPEGFTTFDMMQGFGFAIIPPYFQPTTNYYNVTVLSFSGMVIFPGFIYTN